MLIKLVYGNHLRNGRIPECSFLLKMALEEMGWQVDFEKEIIPGCTNVLIEGFSDQDLDNINNAYRSGTKIFVICTEYLTGNSFNQFVVDETHEQGATHYENNSYWEHRYQQFHEVSGMIKGVFHLAKDQIEVYQEAFPDLPVQYLPHGYIPRMENIEHNVKQRDIDVIFTGTLTPYRYKIIDSMSQRGLKVKVLDTDTPTYLRSHYVARSKIAIQIRQNENWRFSSNSRQHYHLTNRSCLICEKSEIKTDLSQYLLECPADKLSDQVESIINNNEYDRMAWDAYRLFSSEMRMTKFTPKIIDFLMF